MNNRSNIQATQPRVSRAIVEDTDIGRSGSAVVILLPFAITTSSSFRRLDPQQLQSALATGFPFYLFAIVGTGALLLQFFNIAILDAFWPFFTAIVVNLLATAFQFERIILLPPEA